MSSAEIFLQDVLYIYTDGSSIPSPRKGGLGFRFINTDSNGKEHIYDYCPSGYKNSTNNQMELMACVLALRECNRLKLASGKSRIVIRTDSLYIVENYKRAMFEWSKNRWFKSYTAHDYLESLFFMNSGFLFIISKRDIKQ